MSEPWQGIEFVSVDIFNATVCAAEKLIKSSQKLRYDWTDPAAFQARNLETLGASMLRNKPRELVESAASDADHFEALKLGIAHAVMQNEKLPEVASAWMISFLQGKAHSPKKKVGRKSREGLEVLIYFAVQSGVGRGLTATRNDEAKLQLSACDAVATALRNLRLPHADFFAVKKIWISGNCHFAKPENQGIPAT